MQHFAPTHFAQTKRDGLTIEQWIDTYTAERARLGLVGKINASVAVERYELNETPADMAECDKAKSDRLAEGWSE